MKKLTEVDNSSFYGEEEWRKVVLKDNEETKRKKLMKEVQKGMRWDQSDQGAIL